MVAGIVDFNDAIFILYHSHGMSLETKLIRADFVPRMLVKEAI